eukprot:3017904-Pleurochrysis_carterae.AAC.1
MIVGTITNYHFQPRTGWSLQIREHHRRGPRALERHADGARALEASLLSGPHHVRAGASRDDTRAGVILGHADGTAAWVRERVNGEEEWKLLRKRARQGLK